MTITVRDALAALQGFSLCESIKDDSARWNIAKNKRILKGVYEQYEECRTALVKELSPQNSDIGKESPQVIEQFGLRHKTLLEKPCDAAGLLTILKAEVLKSSITPNTIELIFPFIEGNES